MYDSQNNTISINKNIALLELQRGDINRFIKYARSALSLNLEIELANLLAEKYELLGLYNDAIGLYETIIYLDPENINSYNMSILPADIASRFLIKN